METVIKVEHLSKQFCIGAREGYRTFRETLVDAAKAPFVRLGEALSRESKAESREQRAGSSSDSVLSALSSAPKGSDSKLSALRSTQSSRSDDLIWALKDVSFEVKQGEVVGIIGRNGAGKSTLLKILSRITEPTEGRVELRGRVGSLLEVGTGFHPELTGHENIYLYGAILGMDRWEVTRKFNEIVAFAELEKFIDTPVKKYSSGMYMRLAFAVAAHLEPEILLVDEVLAVGDAAFQKKCLGKMGDVAGQGRTVLFVSHNMQAVRQLCSRALILHSGLLGFDGTAHQGVLTYLMNLPKADTSTSLEAIISKLPPDPAFRLKGIFLSQQGQPVVSRVLNGERLEIEIRYLVLQRTIGLRVFFDLYDSEEALIFRSFHDEDQEGIPTVEPGSYISSASIPADILAPIPYELSIQAGIFNVRMCTPDQGVRIPITVEATGRHNRAYAVDTHRGKLALSVPWKTSRNDSGNGDH